MIRVGITGGIGSGKSFVCDILARMGYPVYNADKQAKFLSDTHPHIRSGLIALFGFDIYDGETLNRKKMAEAVFSNRELLDSVNAIIHPVVQTDFDRWTRFNAGSPIVFKEAAILFETGAYRLLDRNIVVTAPESLRIMRVMQRDGVAADRVRERIRMQLPEKEKIRLADFQLINDGKRMLLPQLIAILEQLNQLC